MKLKPVLIILLTLMIGFVIGFLSSSQLRSKRIKNIRPFASERHFRELIIKVTNPGDEQLQQIEPVIKRYGKEGRELQQKFRKEFGEYNKAYWNEIKDLLSDEQVDMWNDYTRKRGKDMRRFRNDTTTGKDKPGRHHRPPPDSEIRDEGKLADSLSYSMNDAVSHPGRKEYCR